ncbi:MAG: TIGR00282 family metallophosphoesterase [Armatimonadetes bacterium]|nr:TIGR00282 family metallophosphoesterase [Armatimonadota bacterium]
MKILFVGDVSGKPGRRACEKLLGPLRDHYAADLVVVNGENAAGGIGITKPTAKSLLDIGADVITLGNHAFAKKDIHSYLEQEPRILRPANYPDGAPGRGWGVFTTANGDDIAVVNLVGRVYMTAVDCPFRCIDSILSELDGETRTTLIDMHAEATSEKVALGWYLDGRVSAVIGTHTHVQTSDERVLIAGTAYLSDAGMTGVHDSVLGLDRKLVIERFLTQTPGQFALAEGEATLQGAVVEIDAATGHALSIVRINVRETDKIGAD